MNTEILNNLKMIAETARDFAEVNIRPHIMEWDESQTFPVDLFHKLGEMGFMGIIIPEEYGGSGLGYHEYVTILDEISQVDPSIGLSVAAHNSLCTNHIYEFGNEEQVKIMYHINQGLDQGEHPTGWIEAPDEGLKLVIKYQNTINNNEKTKENNEIEK